MLKKSSIFTKILVSVIIIMLIQTMVTSLVLYVNGTMRALEDSAVSSLQKNAENRRITLENMMVNNWSNLDKLEKDISIGMDTYLLERNISIEQALSTGAGQNETLYKLSDTFITALRLSLATGIYIYFIDPDNISGSADEYICNGIYFRDLDPTITPADNSDIQLLRGDSRILEKCGVPLDINWSPQFKFSKENIEAWNSLMKPLSAAKARPELSTKDQAFWSAPHAVSQQPDPNECITYTRPLFYRGRLIGMVGTGILTNQLVRYFPYIDFGSSGKAGYMITKYDKEQNLSASFESDIYTITGSYIKRMLEGKSKLTFSATNREAAYTIKNTAGIEPVQVALQPLKLYNTNAPFANEQWALMSIGTEEMLFEAARNLQSGILFSSLIALVVGVVLLAFIIRITTHPLIDMAMQIEKSDIDDPLVITKSDTYEIALLSSTVNAMKEKRRHIEAELREERERYLIALENVADTFMEYDVMQDSLALYHFVTDKQNSVLSSETVQDFLLKIGNGEICPSEDIPVLTSFLLGQLKGPVEVRMKADLFTHISDVKPAGGYFWFSLKASYLYNSDGGIKKAVCIARQITEEKLKEQARIEATLRDATTKQYNREYGLSLIEKQVSSALANDEDFALCVMSLKNFDLFEAYYGRVFAAAILFQLGKILSSVSADGDIVVRIENDKFVVYCASSDRSRISGKSEQISRYLKELYTGGNSEIELSVSFGIAMPGKNTSYDRMFSQAYLAAQYAVKAEEESLAYYSELPFEFKKDEVNVHNNPISISVDISKENLVGFTFDIFESTSDAGSVINLLFAIIGDMFLLRQIIVCAYDTDFGVNQVSYQWNDSENAAYHNNIEKIPHQEFADFEEKLNEDGTLIFKNHEPDGDGNKLLCLLPDEQANIFGCTIYENGMYTGMLLFKAKENDREWTSAERFCLLEITKIISARISVEKSNSASKAKSEFLSRMSHEIRTPMNAIIGMTDIAKESKNDSKRLQDCLDKISFSSKHLLSLINDILDMSRIESGKLKINNEPFSLAGFCETVDILMRSPMDGKSIEFCINQQFEHSNVVGDEYRLRQVVVNLLGNACKFTDRLGKVIFTIEETENQDGFGCYRFSVKDSGIGISREDQMNVFKAFEQATSKSAKKRHDGTGLGLAISSSIISAMNGKIELVSELGEGSEFFFTLRLPIDSTECKASDFAEETIENTKSFFKDKRVLLVEDNEINIEIAEFVLKEAGFSVEVARDGKEGVDKFFASAEGFYDAILMDIHMPVMDGLTATREIRKNISRAEAKTIPIIAMTANAFDDDMKKSIESGMNGHIAKPIETKKLFVLLSKLLKA